MGQRSASKPIGVIRDYSPGGLLGGDIYVPPAGLFGAAPSFGSLTPTEPSYRDTVTDTLRSGLEALGMGRQGAVQNAKGLVGLGEWTPWGALTAADDIKRSYNKGDYLGTGLGLAMFLGPGAKTAKKPMLDLAEEMLAKGATRDEIWNATGWFKGADKKWRFEIDDSASKFQGVNPEPQQTPIRAAVKHPELYSAYPDIVPATVSEQSMPRGAHGSAYGAYRGEPGNGENIALSWSAPDKHSTLLHEIQHGVQSREGFATGGSDMSAFGNDPAVRQAFNSKVEALLKPMPKDQYVKLVGAGWPEATKAQLDASYKAYIKDNRKAHGNVYHPATKAAMETASLDVYKRLAGEVEARNVQKRMNMTADQRKATPPWLTEDVPLDQQIVRFR